MKLPAIALSVRLALVSMAALGLALASYLYLIPSLVSAANPPPHLDILSATVEELPPFDGASVPGRQVSLRIQLAGAPSCTASTAFLAYGFLVDADKNPATGSAVPAFVDLGIDARVGAQCDPVSGAFISLIGTVTIATDPATGAATVEVLTTVAQLPSVDFRWLAFAQEDAVFRRLPKEPDHGAWAILERRVP